jgi:hypothetical protein
MVALKSTTVSVFFISFFSKCCITAILQNQYTGYLLVMATVPACNGSNVLFLPLASCCVHPDAVCSEGWRLCLDKLSCGASAVVVASLLDVAVLAK